MSRQCQWCETKIESQDNKWYSIIMYTGLALYFCSIECVYNWSKSLLDRDYLRDE